MITRAGSKRFLNLVPKRGWLAERGLVGSLCIRAPRAVRAPRSSSILPFSWTGPRWFSQYQQLPGPVETTCCLAVVDLPASRRERCCSSDFEVILNGRSSLTTALNRSKSNLNVAAVSVSPPGGLPTTGRTDDKNITHASISRQTGLVILLR